MGIRDIVANGGQRKIEKTETEMESAGKEGRVGRGGCRGSVFGMGRRKGHLHAEASRAQDTVHLPQGAVHVVDVLEDVEHDDHVEVAVGEVDGLEVHGVLHVVRRAGRHEQVPRHVVHVRVIHEAVCFVFRIRIDRRLGSEGQMGEARGVEWSRVESSGVKSSRKKL